VNSGENHPVQRVVLRVPTPSTDTERLACPTAKPLRDRLRAVAADLVAPWRTAGVPAAARSAAGLRQQAALLVGRAGGSPDHVGWTMVTLVS
jgi:hypothetical protein